MIVLLSKIKIFFYKNHIFFAEKSGLISLDILNIKTNVQILIRKNSLKLLLPKFYLYNAKTFFFGKMNGMFVKLKELYKKKILITGIGFRCWLYKDLLNYTNLVLKIGFSRDLSIVLPACVKVIVLKPALILLRSFDKIRLNQFTSYLLSLKPLDVYKAKGLCYVDQKILLKPGKRK